MISDTVPVVSDEVSDEVQSDRTALFVCLGMAEHDLESALHIALKVIRARMAFAAVTGNA